MQRPKAIIFDLDGVLTDTSEYHYQSWKRLADEEGIPFTRQENDEHLRGVSRKESLTYLLKGRKVPDAQCLVVEDADAGIESAKAGGMQAVGIGPAERFHRADKVLPSLANKHLQDLIN